jgi:hypothetical protein
MKQEWLAAVGESSLASLKTRPDFAITLRNVLVGFIEVKAPGKALGTGDTAFAKLRSTVPSNYRAIAGYERLCWLERLLLNLVGRTLMQYSSHLFRQDAFWSNLPKRSSKFH